MRSILPSLVILGAVAWVAAMLALRRSVVADGRRSRVAASNALAVATLVQGLHFTEELLTGFDERFPALMGLSAMPETFFVAFNAAWLLAWIAAVPGLRAGHAAAFFAAWFLALAGMLNGIAHPLIAAAQGGYFPGLATAPAVGIVCWWLWRRLQAATRRTAPGQRAP